MCRKRHILTEIFSVQESFSSNYYNVFENIFDNEIDNEIVLPQKEQWEIDFRILGRLSGNLNNNQEEGTKETENCFFVSGSRMSDSCLDAFKRMTVSAPKSYYSRQRKGDFIE